MTGYAACHCRLVAALLVALLTAWNSPPLCAADLVRCQTGAVVCVDALAAEIGVDVLERGGTAVDAAVATAFALAVTYPPAGNLGGGGYLLVVPDAAEGSAVFDFREVAPAAATREMFVKRPDRTPHRRVGVPGTVGGLALAHKRFGKLRWRDLVMPAVSLARGGFKLHGWLASDLNKLLADSDKITFAALHQALGHPEGRPWQAGERLVQPQLADVLQRIADHGTDGFYQGHVAELIAAEMRRGGGLVTVDDLAAYRPIERKPLVTTYRGYEILAVPPSSSGGTTLTESLNILEAFDLRSQGRWSAATLHLLIESMRRAFRDRAEFLADPAATKIPPRLVEKSYARRLAATIDRNRATPSRELAGDIQVTAESEQTTHLSVIDKDRTAVSMTYTLENAYGSRVVVAGGGFLLNDEMNDFNWVPGVTNTAGRIGTEPNQVAPGKRMLSSMCPIVMRQGGRTVLVTGSPGGRTIINTVLQMVVNVVDFEMDIGAAVDAPRLHHQWLPDHVRIEPELLEQHGPAIEALQMMGHKIADTPARQGDAHSIWIGPDGTIVGAADRRLMGHAAGY